MRAVPRYRICKRYTTDFWGDLISFGIFKAPKITKILIDKFKKTKVGRRAIQFRIYHLYKKFEKNDKKQIKQKKQTRRRFQSYFSQKLESKKKIRTVYTTLSEKLLKHAIKIAIAGKGKFIDNFCKKLELSLNNLLYKANFTHSPSASRQLINHKFLMVNNKCLNTPNFNLKINGIIQFINKIKPSLHKAIYRKARGYRLVAPYPKYLEASYKAMALICHKNPTKKTTLNLFGLKADHLLGLYPK